MESVDKHSLEQKLERNLEKLLEIAMESKDISGSLAVIDYLYTIVKGTSGH